MRCRECQGGEGGGGGTQAADDACTQRNDAAIIVLDPTHETGLGGSQDGLVKEDAVQKPCQSCEAGAARIQDAQQNFSECVVWVSHRKYSFVRYNSRGFVCSTLSEEATHRYGKDDLEDEAVLPSKRLDVNGVF